MPGSWSPGVNEVEAFILLSQNHGQILIEISIESRVRTQTAYLLVLIAMKQGTQSNGLVTATEENGNKAAGDENYPAQCLGPFQAFRENQTGTQETEKALR
jgi:hypothetical protein